MAEYDVITLGETMLRFTPPNLKRIEQTTSFDVEVGGSESNLAVGLARLGMKPLWLSRLTDNSLGHLIEQTIAKFGVDTSRVIWTAEDRVGLYFLEEGKAPRGSRVVYDRRESAISRMRPSELPVNLFQANRARLLHLSGITPALSQTLALTARQAQKLASEAGWLLSFDLNHRTQLWSPEQALAGCTPFLQAADIILAPYSDVCLVFDLDRGSTSSEQALAVLRERFPQATIVLTLGGKGSIGSEPDGPITRQDAFPAEPVGRLGAGDAFAAGFLYGFLSETEPETRLARALRRGAAMAALKFSIPGEFAVLRRDEVESLMEYGTTGTSLRR
jgi:2-dehydro-3-deoxygluconokinase